MEESEIAYFGESEPEFEPDFEPDFEPEFEPDFEPDFDPEFEPGFEPENELKHWKTFSSKFKDFKGITGYKNTSKTTDPKVRALYHCVSIKQENESVIVRWDGKNSREFFIVSFDELIRLTKKNYHMFELLNDKTTGKVSFDIDGKPEINVTFEEHIINSKKIILTQFPNAKFQISGSKTNDKWSYHIVLSNYIFTDYKKYILKMKAFTKCHPVFDSAIYTNNRVMKCINQSKGYKKDSKTKDDRIQAYIEGNISHSKHLITTDFDEQYFKFEDLDFNDYLVIDKETDISPEKRLQRIQNRKLGIDITQIKPTKQELPLDFSYFNSTQLQKFKVLPKMNNEQFLHHDIIMKVCWWCKFHNISFDDFQFWNKDKNTQASEERKIRYQGYYNGITYYVDNKFLDNLLELYYPKIKTGYPFHRYKHYIQAIDKITNVTIPKNNYINLTDISNLKTEIIAVGCGVGKTQVSIDYIKQSHPGCSVLIIVPRVTLANDITTRFQKSGITIQNYKKLEIEKYVNYQRLCVSASSLHKVDKWNNYDIVIIDEFETLINQFLSPKIHTVKGQCYLYDNWCIFKNFLQKCDKLFLLDAITTMKTVNFVNSMGLTEFNIIDNVKTIERNIIRLKKKKFEMSIDTERRFFNLIANDIKKGLKVFVFMPYKVGRKEHTSDSDTCIRGVIPLTKFFCDKLNLEENKDIIGYYAENHEAKDDLKDVNIVWSQLKCIITNTTNSVGINYEIGDIDKVYIYQSSYTDPRDLIQVVKRPRTIKDNTMILYAEPPQKCLFQNHCYPEFECPVFKQLKKDVQIEKESFSLQSFYALCERNSIDIKEEAVNEEDLEDLIQFEENDDYCIRYKHLRKLTYTEYNELNLQSKGGKINYMEKLEIEKYNFIYTFSSLITDSDLEILWMYRFYIVCFEALLEPNFIMNEFLTKNDINIFTQDNCFVEGFRIDGKVPHNFDLKSLAFLKNFEYLRIEKNTGQSTYAKVLQSFFGPASFKQDKDINHKPIRVIINKNKLDKYTTDSNLMESLELFKKYHTKFIEKYQPTKLNHYMIIDA